jgi:hypothetical protein
MNISLKEITVTGRDGRVTQLDQVYIRGSMIRFFIVPDMLQNAPMSEILTTFARCLALTCVSPAGSSGSARTPCADAVLEQPADGRPLCEVSM